MLGLNRLGRGCIAVGLGLLVAASSNAAPATAGGTQPAGVVDRSHSEWVDELEKAVQAGDGRPTLLEFHYTVDFT
jgi:hypothetical protein